MASSFKGPNAWVQHRRAKRLRASGLSPAGQMDTTSGQTPNERHRKASEPAVGAVVKLTAGSVASMALMQAEVQAPRHHHPINWVVLSKRSQHLPPAFAECPWIHSSTTGTEHGCGAEAMVSGHGGGGWGLERCFPTPVTPQRQ